MILTTPMLMSVLLFTNIILGRGQTATPPVVEVQYCDSRPGKPPLIHMAFNVTVRNLAGKPQWFLFPAALYDKAEGIRTNAGIDAIEMFSDSPEQKITVVYFMGTMNLQPEGAGGFKGLFLPAGAVVSVRALDIEFWGDLAAPLPMRVVMADQVTIGGVPVEQWVGKKLLSAQIADVKDLQHAGSKMAPELKELPVEVTKSGEFEIADALAKKCQDDGRLRTRCRPLVGQAL